MEPLGLLYIKHELEKKDYISCELYDCILSGKTKKLSTPEHFNYLKNIYYEDYSYFSLLSKYFRLGDSSHKIINKVKSENYDLIVISSLFSAYYNDVEKLVKNIKQNCSAKIVLGGWAINTGKEELFKNSNADFFLTGNGEYNLPLLVDALQNKISLDEVAGLIYKKDNSVFYNKNSAYCKISEEFPLRENKYYFNKKQISKVILSRGCLYKCKFCTIHRNQDFSLRSIESIEKELKYLHSIGTEIINFEDDNLFSNKSYAKNLLTLLKKYHQKGLTFAAMNGITAKNILPFIEDIIDAGFIELNLSLVTTDSSISKKTNRPFQLDTLEQVVKKVNGRIKTLVFLILGLPSSTPEIIINDIINLAKLPLTIGVSPLYLLPEVPDLANLGLPENRNLLRGSALYKFPKQFSREDIASLWKFVRMINKIKTFNQELSDIEKDNLYYFKKSLKEKNWYKLTKDNKWEKSFSFAINFPHSFEICKYDGNFYNFHQ